MADDPPPVLPLSFQVRDFCAGDAAACRELYVAGLIAGKLADNDTGLDIDDIQAAYMSDPCSHFWVAALPTGEVVGMIGVQAAEPGVGEIRSLRVHSDYRRRGIGLKLMETAVLI